jgi:hypothetical protein
MNIGKFISVYIQLIYYNKCAFIIFKLRLKLFICANAADSLDMLGPSFVGLTLSYQLHLGTFSFTVAIFR